VQANFRKEILCLNTPSKSKFLDEFQFRKLSAEQNLNPNMRFMQNFNSNMEAISKRRKIGPYWFEDENKRAQTVNTERYTAVLRKFRASLAGQGDSHTSNHTLDWLRVRERFRKRLISRKCDIKWAPHSPGLESYADTRLGFSWF